MKLKDKNEPFKKVIVLGYADGASQGIARLRNGEDVYFEMLWEHIPTETRFYSLWTLPEGSEQSVRTELNSHMDTSIPLLYPVWNFAPTEELSRISGVIDNLISRKQGVHYLVKSADILKSFVESVQLDEESAKKLAQLIDAKRYELSDWESFFEP